MVADTVCFRPLGLIQDAQGDTRFESKVYSLNQDTHGLIQDVFGLSQGNTVQFSTSTTSLIQDIHGLNPVCSRTTERV